MLQLLVLLVLVQLLVLLVQPIALYLSAALGVVSGGLGSAALPLPLRPVLGLLQLFGLLQPTPVHLDPSLVRRVILPMLPESPVPPRYQERRGLAGPSALPPWLKDWNRSWETFDFDFHTSARVAVRSRLWLLQPAVCGIRRTNRG